MLLDGLTIEEKNNHEADCAGRGAGLGVPLLLKASCPPTLDG